MNDALAAVIATTVLTGGVVIISVTAMLVRRKPQQTIAPSHLQEIDAQLRELAASVDSIAVEVERISEGQRFTTKLLAERNANVPDPARPPAKSITPH